MSKKCSLKVVSSNTGKMLYGNAAVLHEISEEGGYDKFISNIVAETISETAPTIAKKIINKQNRKIKLVK